MRRPVRRFLNRWLGNQKGFAGVLAVPGVMALMALFLININFANIFVTFQELQKAADAAALAIVSQAPESEEAARAIGAAFAESHSAGGARLDVLFRDIEIGHYDFSGLFFTPGAEPYNAARVFLARSDDNASGSLPMFWAHLLHAKAGMELSRTAAAAADPHVIGVMKNNRLVPYTVRMSVLDADNDGAFAPGTLVDLYPSMTAPGNFGFLDLASDNQAKKSFEQYVREGYDDHFRIPIEGFIEVEGTPGFLGKDKLAAFKDLLHTVAYFPVHTQVEGEGNNAVYTITDIVSLKINGVRLTEGKKKSIFMPRLSNPFRPV